MPKSLNFRFPDGRYFLNGYNTELKRSSKINVFVSKRLRRALTQVRLGVVCFAPLLPSLMPLSVWEVLIGQSEVSKYDQIYIMQLTDWSETDKDLIRIILESDQKVMSIYPMRGLKTVGYFKLRYSLPRSTVSPLCAKSFNTKKKRKGTSENKNKGETFFSE